MIAASLAMGGAPLVLGAVGVIGCAWQLLREPNKVLTTSQKGAMILDVSETTYTVRLGADGAAKHRTADYDEAMRWAADYAATNWAGKAQVLANGRLVAWFRDGELAGAQA